MLLFLFVRTMFWPVISCQSDRKQQQWEMMEQIGQARKRWKKTAWDKEKGGVTDKKRVGETEMIKVGYDGDASLLNTDIYSSHLWISAGTSSESVWTQNSVYSAHCTYPQDCDMAVTQETSVWEKTGGKNLQSFLRKQLCKRLSGCKATGGAERETQEREVSSSPA